MRVLRLLYFYRNERKERAKINSFYGELEEIISGVSILVALLFNIYICDL